MICEDPFICARNKQPGSLIDFFSPKITEIDTDDIYFKHNRGTRRTISFDLKPLDCPKSFDSTTTRLFSID